MANNIVKDITEPAERSLEVWLGGNFQTFGSGIDQRFTGPEWAVKKFAIELIDSLHRQGIFPILSSEYGALSQVLVAARCWQVAREEWVSAGPRRAAYVQTNYADAESKLSDAVNLAQSIVCP